MPQRHLRDRHPGSDWQRLLGMNRAGCEDLRCRGCRAKRSPTASSRAVRLDPVVKHQALLRYTKPCTLCPLSVFNIIFTVIMQATTMPLKQLLANICEEGSAQMEIAMSAMALQQEDQRISRPAKTAWNSLPVELHQKVSTPCSRSIKESGGVSCDQLNHVHKIKR